MKLLKTAAAVINQTPFDWTGNVNRLRELLVEAKAKEISVEIYPKVVFEV